MFSSATDEWATPQPLFDRLNAEYGPFTLDVCATPENTKCVNFYTRKDNGIVRRWWGHVWMNCPYGRSECVCLDDCQKKTCKKRGWHRLEHYYGADAWVPRAYRSVTRGGADLVCCLLPARTDCTWFQDYVLPYAEVEFIRRRVRFGGHKNSAPFPSCVAVFRRKQIRDSEATT